RPGSDPKPPRAGLRIRDGRKAVLDGPAPDDRRMPGLHRGFHPALSSQPQYRDRGHQSAETSPPLLPRLAQIGPEKGLLHRGGGEGLTEGDAGAFVRSVPRGGLAPAGDQQAKPVSPGARLRFSRLYSASL